VRPPPVTTRVARPSDAETMARTTALGFATYRSFGASGATPPPLGADSVRERLGRRDTWALLAFVAGEPAGHVALFPDWRREETAYLWQLFVRPAWWGSGLAATLHGAFVEEAVGRGFRTARLNTPAAHARARRFYERNGWVVSGPPEAWGGLVVAEYRCALPS
jgi:GNAT superfamily N-acetyltransferase